MALDVSDKLYSIPAAGEFLGGISKWTIRAWLAKGKLRPTKVGSRTMIRESELRRVIEDGANGKQRESCLRRDSGKSKGGAQ